MYLVCEHLVTDVFTLQNTSLIHNILRLQLLAPSSGYKFRMNNIRGCYKVILNTLCTIFKTTEEQSRSAVKLNQKQANPRATPPPPGDI
jgi:hypothetical protein